MRLDQLQNLAYILSRWKSRSVYTIQSSKSNHKFGEVKSLHAKN